jgi:hypothetical protein
MFNVGKKDEEKNRFKNASNNEMKSLKFYVESLDVYKQFDEKISVLTFFLPFIVLIRKKDGILFSLARSESFISRISLLLHSRFLLVGKKTFEIHLVVYEIASSYL